MKTKLALLFLLLFAVALPACAQDVLVDYDHSIDFTQYRTFAWATGPYPVQDQVWSERLAIYVETELLSQGVSRILPEKNFDLFVSYNMNVVVDANQQQIVKVTVRVADARNNVVVWRAAASDKYVDDDQQNIQTVRSLVQLMFQQWPTGN